MKFFNWYNISISNKWNLFDYYLYCTDTRDRISNHKFRLNLPYFDFSEQATASKTELRNQNNINRMKLLYSEFCKYACIQDSDEWYNEFSLLIQEELLGLMYKPINFWTKVPVVKEKEVDPEISDAIHITNEAIKVQKEIVEKISYINKLRNDYYAKYGTFIEKTMAYLQLK